MDKPGWSKSPPALVEVFEAVFPGSPAVARQMFGYPAGFVNGNMFMGLHQENMVLRLPDGPRAELLAIEGAATFEPRWIEAAQELAGQMVDLFWDEQGGGFFSTGTDHEALLVRQKELVESVTPSPNGVAALLLQKMAIITGDETQAERARQILRLARTLMERAPQAAPSFLAALDFHLGRPKEVVIVSPGDGAGEEAELLLRTVWDRFLPNRVLAGAPPGIPSPLLEGKRPKGGVATAFVCEGYACRAPTTDPAELGRLLDA